MKAAKTLAALAVATGMAATASAATINIGTSTGTIYSATNFDHEVDGDDMDGMLVTARVIRSLGGGNFEIVTLTEAWDADFDGSGDHGGVAFGSPDFDLEVQGDTFDNDVWDLDFSFNAGPGDPSWRLLSLAFDGRSGNTVFDRTCGGVECTPGSSLGKDFQNFSDWNTGTINVTYSNAVALGANAPLGDVWANLLIAFGDGTFLNALPEGGSGDDDYHFTLDTDNARLQEQPVPSVPEPGSMLLLGSGLVGLVARMRRKKQ